MSESLEDLKRELNRKQLLIHRLNGEKAGFLLEIDTLETRIESFAKDAQMIQARIKELQKK